MISDAHIRDAHIKVLAKISKVTLYSILQACQLSPVDYKHCGTNWPYISRDNVQAIFRAK